MKKVMKSVFASILLIGMGIGTFAVAMDLPVTEHVLSNGMKILAAERHSAPAVTLAIYYRAGSIDESPHQRGMAHYMEHMMFKSTKYLQSESFARLVGAVGGGDTNASTTSDRTEYHATAPPDRLELLIRLEAERMANLQPSRPEAASELEVVCEELRHNYIDNPEGRFRFEFFKHAYLNHPYGVPTIGTLEDLKSITYENMIDFYHRFYAPNRAVAVVAGDFKTSEMLHLMEQFFGVIPKGPDYQRTYPEDSGQTSERRFELKLPVRQASYMSGYKIPDASDPDIPALWVLSAVLSYGQSSPIGKLSKGDEPVAQYAYAYCQKLISSGLFVISGLPLPGMEVEKLEHRIDEIIQKIQTDGASEQDISRAKSIMLSREIYDMQSSLGIASKLGESEMTSSWKDAAQIETILEKVSLADVQRAAQKYLRVENRTVGILIPSEEK
jgi:zinc protease